MKKTSDKAPPVVTPAIEEEAIRDYAYHLYEQSGRVPGHDLDHWLEARACLAANLPAQHTRTRLHRMAGGLGPLQQAELCATAAEAHNVDR
jgi:hypothetical protein